MLDVLKSDKQHFVHLLAVGGLYMATEEVDEALRFIPDVPRAILDLGTFEPFCGLA